MSNSSEALKKEAIKTRFCPSPTGAMHLGNIRTALFNALLAKSADGQFLLRIEDTDRERSDVRYAELLEQDLLWLGLDWQEGPSHDGGNGPYQQSRRQPIYDDYFQRLQTAGSAYPCFCSEEDLALSRKVQRSSGKPPRYAGTCRDLTDDEIAAKIADGIQPTLRFRVPLDETIEFEDLVRGPQRFSSDDIGDFIIRRANGSPPFLFCNALDDALMGVTHALRGEDHITNTPRQLMVLEALGLSAPAYGHIALIVGNDGSPLSKRHGSRSIEELRKQGYCPLAIVNYIARLGHYYGHDEFLSVADLAAQFRLESLAKSPAKFNNEQMNHWQKEAVMRLDDTGFWIWVGEEAQDRVPKSHRAMFVEAVKSNVCFPEEVVHWIDILFGKEFQLSETQKAMVAAAEPDYFKVALASVKETGLSYSSLVQQLKNQLNVKGKSLFMPLRVALTGESQGPELEKIMRVMELEEVMRRLEVHVANI